MANCFLLTLYSTVLSNHRNRFPTVIIRNIIIISSVSFQVSFYRREAGEDNDDAIVDIAIMSKATYFIGNCVSSFSSFVRRQRNSTGKPVAFFSLD